MNELNLHVPSEPDVPQPTYKDRYTGLVIFGVLTLLLGAICGLMVPVMLFGQIVSARHPNAPSTGLLMVLPGLLMYLGLAISLISLGIGSIKARRWARALILIFAWSWLMIGVIMTVLLIIFLPTQLADLAPPANQQSASSATIVPILIFTFLLLGVLFIALPAVWIFFYGNRHVKATCEARDPVPRWTDACPLPVLAVSLWLWIAVPMLLLVPLANHGVAPFFGIFIKGVSGGAFYWLMAAIWAWMAWRLYHLDTRAWWVLLAVLLLFLASNLITYLRHDISEMYRLMGYPPAQIDQMQKSGVTSNSATWMTIGAMLPFLGYLLMIKKHLPAKQ